MSEQPISIIMARHEGFIDGLKHASVRSKWISTSYRMPEPGEDVLAFNSHNKDQSVLHVWEGRFCDASGSYHNYPEGRITHWQPLPEAPEK